MKDMDILLFGRDCIRETKNAPICDEGHKHYERLQNMMRAVVLTTTLTGIQSLPHTMFAMLAAAYELGRKDTTGIDMDVWGEVLGGDAA